jgi:uncharacterized membrane protein YoaK (UPF0700 family)
VAGIGSVSSDGAPTGVLGEIRSTLWSGSGGRHGPLPSLLLMLTLLTGVVDAASYLTLGHVFVANMTGNIVFLGFGLAGAGDISIAASLTALAAFLLGAFAGGWLGARYAEHRGHILRAAGTAQVVLLLIALLVALGAAEPIGSGTRYALIAPLAIAMGIQNAAVQRIGVPELTTTVLTKTLAGIASEARALGGGGSQLGRRGLAVLAMLLGALCGGLLVLKVSVASALALALALAGLVALAVHVLSRGESSWSRPSAGH